MKDRCQYKIAQPSTDFLEEFKRVQSNPVYFMKHYWNTLNADNQMELSKEEREELYDQLGTKPIIKQEMFGQYIQWIEEMKQLGFENWEMHLIEDASEE